MHIEMPKYKCYKEVHALKIKNIDLDSIKAHSENRETDGSAMLSFFDEGYGDLKVDSNYLAKHKPEVGGYFVVYKDGYKSFSPSEAFETGYERI